MRAAGCLSVTCQPPTRSEPDSVLRERSIAATQQDVSALTVGHEPEVELTPFLRRRHAETTALAINSAASRGLSAPSRTRVRQHE